MLVAETKQPKTLEPEALTKIRISWGASFSFEAEGRESIVMDAYTRAIEAWVDLIKPEEKKRG
jgi:hypothetical protein